MAPVRLSDLQIPANWAEYVIERTAAKSSFWQSGIIDNSDPRFNKAANSGGQSVNMPLLKDLTGRSEVLSETVPLTVNKITSALEKAVIHHRGKAWGSSDLAGAISGTDPLGAIAESLSDWWSRELNTLTLETVQGIFAAPSMASNVNDQSANTVTPSILIDSANKLGDAANKLTGWAFHSSVYGQLEKLNLITFRKFSDQGEDMPFYLGKQVIVDDSLPNDGTVVTSYLFGAGSIAFGEAEPDKQQVELDRDSLQGEDYLIMRRKFILHVRGVSFTGIPAGVSPTDAEMILGTNYTRVYEPKNIPLVKLVTKV